MPIRRTAPMPPIIALKKPAVEIAHILQKHIEDYKRQYRLGPEHQKIVSNLSARF
jgi:hypothetical protein